MRPAVFLASLFQQGRIRVDPERMEDRYLAERSGEKPTTPISRSRPGPGVCCEARQASLRSR
jgi:hypothetical protein